MLQDEYDRLAKSVGYVSERQAKDIIYIALEKIKRDANAGIVEVWAINHDVRGVGILRSYIRLADRGIPAPQDIVLDNDARGLLVWVAEKRKPIWMNDIRRGASSGRNLLTDEDIGGRYFNIYENTRAFAAVPIEHWDQLQAIVTIEVTDENQNRIEKECI